MTSDPEGHRRPLRRIASSLIALALLVGATVPVARESAASTLLEAGWGDSSELKYEFSPKEYSGSMYWVTNEITGAADFWSDGYTGEGIDIALIDSGVVPVNGLTYPGKIINGPDLSFESQAENLRYLDTFGHGTHIAGIIAGRDDRVSSPVRDAESQFVGMAPGARLINIKVADAQGAVDVSQVIAAIDWVVTHRTDNGMNIRVLNLSYGTDGLQDYQLDPLTHAVERAWQAGIVVVVASGNDGNAAPLRNPAYDPFVIAVGASEGNWTYSAHDDTIPEFSSCGTPDRHVDVVAPGQSIVSLRNPGSYADTTAPEAAVAGRFFLGSGTSQAAAVVSGAVALILDQRPHLSPDQVKALLMDTAQPINNAKGICQGAGLIDLRVARGTDTADAGQNATASLGMGSLEAARGSHHVYDEKVALEGEIDIMGSAWDGYCAWHGEVDEAEEPEEDDDDRYLRCLSTLWDGGHFNGEVWSGNSWSGNSWSGNSWSGNSWSGNSWSGNSWSGKTWSGNSWSGNSWSGNSWSGGSWSGGSWSGNSWSGVIWE